LTLNEYIDYLVDFQESNCCGEYEVLVSSGTGGHTSPDIAWPDYDDRLVYL